MEVALALVFLLKRLGVLGNLFDELEGIVNRLKLDEVVPLVQIEKSLDGADEQPCQFLAVAILLTDAVH